VRIAKQTRVRGEEYLVIQSPNPMMVTLGELFKLLSLLILWFSFAQHKWGTGQSGIWLRFVFVFSVDAQRRHTTTARDTAGQVGSELCHLFVCS
jgi:hypothetical protein